MKKLTTLFALFLLGCGQASEKKIGTQTWAMKNLDVSTFKNGDAIPQAKTKEEWNKASEENKPAWCYYDNDAANSKKYGKLYNWFAVNDSRGLAPAGWHIPTDKDWSTLNSYLGKEEGKKMKSTSGWKDGGNGNNNSGFTGLPGGGCAKDMIFTGIDSTGYWWCYDVDDTGNAWVRSLKYDIDFLYGLSHLSIWYNGFSVRCIKD